MLRRAQMRVLQSIAGIKAWLRATHMNVYIRLFNRPVVFKDWAGNRFWQYAGNKIYFNCKRRSVTDAIHVMEYIRRTVRPGWICIDIGANIGAVSIAMWKTVGKTGQVISVEADPQNAPLLEKNLLLNGLPTSLIESVAITDAFGVAELRCFPEANGWQTLGQGASYAQDHVSFTVEVKTIPFPELLIRSRISFVDLVKIDVEGAELLVLRSMRDCLLERKVRRVIFEVNEPVLQGMGSSVKELFAFWHDLEFDLFELTEQGVLLSMANRNWDPALFGDCCAISRALN